MSGAKPKYISFHITNRCNSRCMHCRLYTVREPEAPPPSFFSDVIDQLAGWIGPAEIIVAGGEPLMTDRTYHVIRRAHAFNMRSVLVTNGYLVNDEVALKLADAGLSIANISLDGYEPTHDLIRNKPGAFNLAMRAIRALDQAGIKVRITSVILDDNIDQIVGLTEFLARDGRVDGIFFQAMAQPFGENGLWKSWWKTNPLFPKNKAAAHAALDKLLALKRNIGFVLNEDFQFPALKAYIANPGRFSQAQCTVGNMGFTITPNGNVYLCNHMDPIGNISDGRTIRAIFESEKSQAIRKAMKACTINCHLLINCSFDPEQLL